MVIGSNVSSITSTNDINKVQSSNMKDVNDYLAELNIKCTTPNVDIKMSNSFIHAKGKITLSLPPDLVKSAMTNKESAKKVQYAIDNMPKLEEFIRTHALPDGTRAKSVSVIFDKNGECQTYIECEKPKEKAEKEDKDSTKEVEEKLKKKKKKIDLLKKKADQSINPYDASVYQNIINSTNYNIINTDR